MTRTEYMQASQTDGPSAHRAYYSQFVSEQTIDYLLRYIEKEWILNSTKEHFNDIPLKKWENCPFIIKQPMQNFGDYLTVSSKVCILKEAAKQVKENN